MASFQFKNVHTGELKVINSKDAVTAKRVYTNKTWEYVKAVPHVKSTKPAKTVQTVNKTELLNMLRGVYADIQKIYDLSSDYGFCTESPALSAECKMDRIFEFLNR